MIIENDHQKDAPIMVAAGRPCKKQKEKELIVLSDLTKLID
jgi:hypothetical protein